MRSGNILVAIRNTVVVAKETNQTSQNNLQFFPPPSALLSSCLCTPSCIDAELVQASNAQNSKTQMCGKIMLDKKKTKNNNEKDGGVRKAAALLSDDPPADSKSSPEKDYTPNADIRPSTIKKLLLLLQLQLLLSRRIE